MKRQLLVLLLLSAVIYSSAQTVSQKLRSAYGGFEKDPQLRYAISSLYVIDANTGAVVFDKNSRVGLAPASTQKIITGVTAFELLGKDYRYRTAFYTSNNDRSQLDIIPGGDPTFGSWRWERTHIDTILDQLNESLRKKGVTSVKHVRVDDSGWDAENIPDGWIWQDIGNYYGAGAHKLNYRENQYDIILKSGNQVGDSVSIVSLDPLEIRTRSKSLVTKLTSARRGSGDNAYVYLPEDKINDYKIRGTIPVNENRFSISASITDPESVFSSVLLEKLNGMNHTDANTDSYSISGSPLYDEGVSDLLFTYYSPSLDSLIYWFNKKSVNLYGEALIKTMAWEKKGTGSTEEGVGVVRQFWEDKGIDRDELVIVDGSGLSPMNRVTTHAQVEILKYAKKRDWFPDFLNSLPEYNHMTMKSGTIRGVKGFTGYHKARNGKEYIFSFLVNNYNGSPSSLVAKMYRVLDLLK